MPAGLEPIDDAPPSFALDPDLEDAPPPMFDDEPPAMFAGDGDFGAPAATGPMTPESWEALLETLGTGYARLCRVLADSVEENPYLTLHM